MTRRHTSPPLPPAPPSTTSPGPADRLPSASDGLALIKPAVRSQAGYTLTAPEARRKLNQNESPFDFPPVLKQEVMEQAVAQAWQRYPPFVPGELQQAIATRYRWTPDGVVVGNGSNELIQATLSVTLEAGDAVVAPSPTFSLYRLITGVLGGRYIPVPLGDDFRYDISRLIDAAQRERARVIVLNSPNNPTGSAYPPGAVEEILAGTDALILCDEAYQDFGGTSAIPQLSQSSRIVVLRTFSKAFGLAGLRFGFGLAHPAVAAEIAKGKLPYNVNLVTLAAARVALRHSATLTARVEELVAERERFLKALRRLPGLVVYPTAANFVLIRCLALPARDVFERLHHRYGILVRDVSALPELAECLRISVGTADDSDAVIDALGEILSEYRAPGA